MGCPGTESGGERGAGMCADTSSIARAARGCREKRSTIDLPLFSAPNPQRQLCTVYLTERRVRAICSDTSRCFKAADNWIHHA